MNSPSHAFITSCCVRHSPGMAASDIMGRADWPHLDRKIITNAAWFARACECTANQRLFGPRIGRSLIQPVFKKAELAQKVTAPLRGAAPLRIDQKTLDESALSMRFARNLSFQKYLREDEKLRITNNRTAVTTRIPPTPPPRRRIPRARPPQRPFLKEKAGFLRSSGPLLQQPFRWNRQSSKQIRARETGA